MRVALAADHGGVELKDALVKHLQGAGFDVVDLGTHGGASVDYPDYAQKAADGLLSGQWQRAILVCGTGLGMSIAANRHRHVRAACVSDTYSARLSREHNDANVLCLGARVLGLGLAFDLAELFLRTEASTEPRHLRRLEKLEALGQS